MTEDGPREEGPDEIEIRISDGFEAWLHEQGTSLVFAMPPAKLCLVGLDADGELSVFERTFDKCMGIAHVATRTLYLGTRHHVWRLENSLRDGELTEDGYDRRFVPLHCSTTGYLNTHDLGVERDGRVLLVNTRFGCLAECSETHHFAPVWWPPFLPGPWPNDRCHLNGLAIRDGAAAFVTSVSRTAAVDSWRRHRRDGGTVTDVASGEIVATGLSMPHSPRWHRDRLWVANAGSGQLGSVDLATGHEFTQLNAAAHGVGQQFSDPLSMLIIFSAVPVLVEAIYRLIPLPILLWLISNVVLRGRWQSPVYWLLAVPLSLWEPLTQTIVVPGIGPDVFAREVMLGFALNFSQAWFFRKQGFVSSIAVREAYYLIWHVLYVH